MLNFVKRVGGSAAPSWRAATGGTRVARRAGASAERSVTPTPTSTAMRMVRGSRAMPAVGMSAPTALKSALMPLATPRPATMPTAEASTPSVSASATTEREHLAAAGAEGAQHRELAAPLRDGDAEGVEDDERADEDGDAGERQEHRREERADRVGRLRGRVGGSLLARLDADAGRQGGLDVARRASLGVTPGSAETEMPLILPGSPPQRCTSCRRPAMTMVPPRETESPHSKTPATLTFCEAGRGGDAEGVAGLEPGLVGEALDDRDLVAALDLARRRRGSPG